MDILKMILIEGDLEPGRSSSANPFRANKVQVQILSRMLMLMPWDGLIMRECLKSTKTAEILYPSNVQAGRLQGETEGKQQLTVTETSFSQVLLFSYP